jgi:pilus assembly protein CpaB
MKWSVAVLVTLGLLAGLSAAILVKFMRSGDSGIDGLSPETEIVMMSKDMPAMSILKTSDVTVKAVKADMLPAGYLSDAVQAVGRILAVPVVEGQVLTESSFVENGTSAQVAASLPVGMRAVSLSLSSTSINGGLLYPGCVVDVLASFRLSSSERGQALSTTLLRGINVLAVQGTTVVSQKEEEEDNKTASRTAQGRLTVTLMVDPKQAEALQLATDHGQISLSLRNPLDKSPVDTEATVLSQGRLAQLGSAMTAAVLADEDKTDANEITTANYLAETDTQTETDTQRISEKRNYDEISAKGKLSWPVTVIRGTQIQQEDLDMPELKVSAKVSAKR